MKTLTCRHCEALFVSKKPHPYCSHRCANRARVLPLLQAPLGYLTLYQAAAKLGWTRGAVFFRVTHKDQRLRLPAMHDGRRWLVNIEVLDRILAAGVFRRKG